MKACFQAVLIGALLVMPACARSDAGISSAVKAKLIADDSVKADSIEVETQGRVVTLSGRVSMRKQQEAKAIKIARGTRGVTLVESRLRIARNRQPQPRPGAAETRPPTDKPAGDAGISEYQNASARGSLVSGLDVHSTRPLGDVDGQGAERSGETTRGRDRAPGRRRRGRGRQADRPGTLPAAVTAP